MKLYTHKLLTLLALLVLAGSLQAQQRVDRDVFDDKTILDGFVVGTYGSVFYMNGWQVEAAPGIGYRFLNDRVIMGGGLSWSYFSRVYREYGLTQSLQFLGPRAFVKVNPIWQVYAIGEYQYLNIKYEEKYTHGFNPPVERLQEDVFYVGAGYAGGDFGKGFGFYLELMVDVLFDNMTSVRNSPLSYRIGVFYGF